MKYFSDFSISYRRGSLSLTRASGLALDIDIIGTYGGSALEPISET
jgi:hypothetical protein